MRVWFADGTVGTIDLFDRLEKRGHVLGALRFDQPLFAQVAVDATGGALVWPNGASLGAEELYYAVPLLQRPWRRGLYSFGLAPGDDRRRVVLGVALVVALLMMAAALFSGCPAWVVPDPE